MMNVYNGNVTTDGKGFATVKLPAYFQALNRDFRYQLTILGHAPGARRRGSGTRSRTTASPSRRPTECPASPGR